MKSAGPTPQRSCGKNYKEEQQRELPDLAQTLADLKAAGFTQAAVQSLHVVPGEEWEKTEKIRQGNSGAKNRPGQTLVEFFG